jgi:hypothetical protein
MASDLSDRSLQSLNQPAEILGICHEVIQTELFECVLIAVGLLPQSGALLHPAPDAVFVLCAMHLDKSFSDSV